MHPARFRRRLRGSPYRLARLPAALLIALAIFGTESPVRAHTAEPDTAWTAAECVARAVAQNPRLRAARHSSERARAALSEERTRRLPELSGQGTYRRLSPNVPDFEFQFPDLPGLPGDGEPVSIAPAIRDRYDFTLEIEQPLFAGGGIHYGIQSQEHASEAASARTRESEREIALAVRQTYWNLYGARNQREAIEAALRQVEAHLENVEAMREAGTALESDVLALRTRRSEVELQLLRAEEEAEVARMRLNRLIGRPLEAPLLPADTVRLAPEPPDSARLLRASVERRPELRAQREQIRAAEDRIRVAQSGWWPQVGLVGQYQYARPNPLIVPQEDEFTGTWTIGLSASLDLWNWGRTQDRVQQARASARQEEDLLVDARSEVRLAVRENLLALRRARQSVELARRSRREASEQYRLARTQFEEGAALSADVLAAEAAFRRARTRYVRALAEYASSRASLAHAAGVPVESLR